MKCDVLASPNRSVRRVPVTAIVIHYTGTVSLQSTLSWFLTPESQVSAHYVIGRDGRVVQMVREEDVAWHAGRSMLAGQSGVNAFSIGIELAATAASGFTAEQMVALEALLRELTSRYAIPPERVVGHSDIAPGRKVDPGPLFDWARVREALRADSAAAAGG